MGKFHISRSWAPVLSKSVRALKRLMSLINKYAWRLLTANELKKFNTCGWIVTVILVWPRQHSIICWLERKRTTWTDRSSYPVNDRIWYTGTAWCLTHNDKSYIFINARIMRERNFINDVRRLRSDWQPSQLYFAHRRIISKQLVRKSGSLFPVSVAVAATWTRWKIAAVGKKKSHVSTRYFSSTHSRTHIIRINFFVQLQCSINWSNTHTHWASAASSTNARVDTKKNCNDQNVFICVDLFRSLK